MDYPMVVRKALQKGSGMVVRMVLIMVALRESWKADYTASWMECSLDVSKVHWMAWMTVQMMVV